VKMNKRTSLSIMGARLIDHLALWHANRHMQEAGALGSRAATAF
jgi:hypothetical protein